MTRNDFESRQTIKNRFVILMLVTNILLVSAILVPSYITIKSYLSESAEAYTTALLNEKVNKLEQDFKETSKLVNVLNVWIAEAFDLDRALSESEYMSEFREMLIRQFKAYLGQNKFNTSLYIYFNYDLFNAEYDVWYNRIDGNKYELQPKLGDAYFEDYHAWYNKPIDKGVALWTKPYTAINGPFSGNQLTSYVSPVLIDNKAIAVIGVDLYIDEIIEIVKDLKLYDTGYVYVLQEDGHVLYHPYLDVDQVYADSETSQQLLDAFNNNPSGILSYLDDDGYRIYSAYGHLENGWLLATHVPEKEVFSKLSELLNVLIIFILITMLVILIITNLIVVRIFKPIEDLTEEMSILDSGNLKKGISSKLLEDDTEIGILANEVDSMRLRLLESFNRIEIYNNELENIVNHRTKDLQEALKQVQENQHAVIELERNKGMSVLMKNLAHRLNTPLGTSITMTSYLKKLIESDEINIEDINEAMSIIESSQNRVKDVINQLGYILEADKKSEYILLDIEKIFAKAQSSLGLYHPHAIDLTFENKITSSHLISQVYLLQSFARILTFLLDHTKENVAIHIKAYEEDNDLIILIDVAETDIPFDIEDIFTPFHSSNFEGDERGLDMFIAYDLVTRCMNGEIKSIIDENGRFTLRIKI